MFSARMLQPIWIDDTQNYVKVARMHYFHTIALRVTSNTSRSTYACLSIA